MLISTRGRYALRVLLDLAQHQSDGYIAMKSVAERQGLSLKYIEKIMPVLSKNNYVVGVHGKGGGYRLSGEQCNAEKCDRAETCPTLPMWTDFYKLVNDYFDDITLADLMKNVV